MFYIPEHEVDELGVGKFIDHNCAIAWIEENVKNVDKKRMYRKLLGAGGISPAPTRKGTETRKQFTARYRRMWRREYSRPAAGERKVQLEKRPRTLLYQYRTEGRGMDAVKIEAEVNYNKKRSWRKFNGTDFKKMVYDAGFDTDHLMCATVSNQGITLYPMLQVDPALAKSAAIENDKICFRYMKVKKRVEGVAAKMARAAIY